MFDSSVVLWSDPYRTFPPRHGFSKKWTSVFLFGGKSVSTTNMRFLYSPAWRGTFAYLLPFPVGSPTSPCSLSGPSTGSSGGSFPALDRARIPPALSPSLGISRQQRASSRARCRNPTWLFIPADFLFLSLNLSSQMQQLSSSLLDLSSSPFVCVIQPSLWKLLQLHT